MDAAFAAACGAAPAAPGLPPVPASVVHLLKAAAESRPRAPALRDGVERLDYAGLAAAVGALARRLAAHVRPGDRVAIVLQNSLDLVVALYAVHALRAQVAALNPRYGVPELAALLADAAPAAVIHDGSEPGLQASFAALPAGAVIEARGGHAFAALAGSGVALPTELPTHDDLATLQYTGGTTGGAKGVDILHRQLAWNLAQREALLPTRHGDEVVLCVTPLFHVSAVAMCLHLAAYAASELVLMRRFDAREAIELIGRHGVTRLSGVPTVYYDLVHALRADDRPRMASLRGCYSGAAALPVQTLDRFHELTGCTIYEGYGASEVGPCVSYNPEGRPPRHGSVGIAVPASELRVVDVDAGTPLPPGAHGEIEVRGPHVMAGYRHRPELTAAVLRDGWYATGDVGSLDGDGYLTIHGRRHDTINVGGFKVYPLEIEQVLLSACGVGEAAAFAVADERLGQVVHAWVTPAGGRVLDVETLRQHCRGRLAGYKVPRRIGVLERLPRTPVGKLARAALHPVGA